MSSKIDLSDFELIRLAAEEHNLSNVANRANKSISAVSTRLRKFENELGARLVRRSPQFGLTDAGHLVLKAGSAINNEISQMRGAIAKLRLSPGQIRIMCATSIMIDDLPLIAVVLNEKYPGTKYHHREGSFGEIQLATLEGRCDVGLLGPTPPTPGLTYTTYKSERVCLIAPLGNPLAQQTRMPIPLSAALGYDFIGTDNSKRISQFLDDHARDEGRTINYVVTTSSFESQIEWVAKTQFGLAMVLESSATRAIERGLPVKKIILSNEWASGKFQCCVRSDIEQPELIQEFIRLLTARFCQDK